MTTNIAKIRESQGITQVELADRLDIHVTNLNRIERGKSSPSTARLEQIARALGVPVSDLIADHEPATVPLMGYLGAGGQVEPDFEQVPSDGLDQIPVPFPLPDEMVAFKVSGISMLPVFKPDSIIIVYREQKKPIESFYGYEAAVRTADGRRYIKTINRGARNGTVNLSSWNDPQPIENVRLEWIGEIFAVLPPSAIKKVVRQGGIQGQLRLKSA